MQSRLIIIISFLFLTHFCFAQGFEYKKTENIYEKFISKPDIEFIDVKDYLPKDYVKDGTVDYSKEIQKAINENKNIEFPDFPVLIKGRGLQLKNGTNIFFNKNSKLILAPNDKKHYRIIEINNIQNVAIYNPKIVGDREKHIGTEGQWGMGIHIENSQNINIYNSAIKNTWGDGIYITSRNGKSSNNINIKYGFIDNVRRNGISIISGDNISIDSLQISNVNGHNPASGIDIEPNKNTNKSLKNITINYLYTFNNEKDGVVLNLKNLIDGKKRNEGSIKLTNHKDDGGRYGLSIVNNRPTGKRLLGTIHVKHTNYLNSKNKETINITNNTRVLPNFILRDFKTNNMSQKEYFKHIKEMIKNDKYFRYNN